MDAKERIVQALDTLPEETLSEVMTFVEYLEYRQTHPHGNDTPYVPIQLEGLWEGIDISPEDIDEVRDEMWANFGELDE